MSLNRSVIDLSVSMFDWARFRRTKGAIKLHLLLDRDGYLPFFGVVTEGKASELKVARSLPFEPGTILAIDRGYIDYDWFARLTSQEVYFVTRMKENAVYVVQEEFEVPQNRNVRKDQLICFPSQPKAGEEPCLFRRVEIWDENKQESIVFLTNLLASGAKTIAAIYKDRWQVEAVLQGDQTEPEDQDVCGDQRERCEDAGVDRPDCHPGAEVPATEVEICLVLGQFSGLVAAAVVRPPQPVSVAGRPVPGPTRAGGGAQCSIRAGAGVVDEIWTAEMASGSPVH